MLEDSLRLRERLQFAVEILGFVAARRAEDFLRGPVKHQQEARLRKALTRGILTPAHGRVDLVATEEELSRESARQVDGVDMLAVQSERLDLILTA